VLLVEPANEAPELHTEHALERHRFWRHHIDVEAPRAKRTRNLEPDEARPDNDSTATRLSSRNDAPAIGERAKQVDLGTIRAGDVEPDGIGARGEEETVVPKLAPVIQRDLTARGLEGGDPATNHLDSVLLVEARWPERNPLLGCVPGQIVLRQIRPIVRRRGVWVDERDSSVEPLASQHLGGGASGRTRPHNDDGRWGGSRAGRPSLRSRERIPLELLRECHPTLLDRDSEGGNGVESRGSQRLARPHIEAGVMPGTAYRGADDQTLAQRPRVMGARRADRRDLSAATGE